MMQVQIAGAIASKTGVTLYLANGGEMNLPTDSWKTKEILDQVVAPLARGDIVTLNLSEYSVEKKIEDKTGGVIRFIKQTMGQLADMLADLEKGLEPNIPTAAESNLNMPGDLAAVVKDEATGKETVIPGVEKIRKQLDHAAKSGNVKGLQNFMKRIAGVKTGHTVQELLNFMEKGDLPIADDGSIVAYKVLVNNDADKGIFMDKHSKKVLQKLGSRVSMAAKLVDPSRRTQCSSGLHIARRKYLGSFAGNVITIVKIAPEDVVAVPTGEPDKMRVAAYHIVGLVPKEAHSALYANRAMTDNDTASKMLADVIAGNHIGIVEEVRIGEDGGKNITRQTTAEALRPAPEPFKNGSAKALEDEAKMEQPITPKQIREQAQAAKAAVVETKAQRDARKKREKRAAQAAEKAIADQKAASAKAVKARTTVQPAPADEARFHAFGNGKVAEKILDKPAVTETKSQRDARLKREKRAKAKLTSKPTTTLHNPTLKPSSPPGETKAQRDARKKREKRAAAKKG